MKRILIAVASFVVLPTFAMAQSGSLSVVTSPPGAEVVLEGEARVAGVSPITFTYLLVGNYRLSVSKRGFETYTTALLLDPDRPQQVEVRLSPKTTAKATLRSFFIPGWGQRYSGQRTKSWLFYGLFAGSAINLFQTHDTYLTKRDEHALRVEEYDAAVLRGGNQSDLLRHYALLVAAQQVAVDAQNDRRTAIIVTAGIWGLNLIDALLFTPSERSIFAIKGLTVVPSADPSSAGLTLAMAF